ncbi:ABC transporter permease subunit [Mesorhizobium australicum]|uniref:ABC transporter permease n=1 Tax=Mesorhizobium australicum TaxID=536018 RepID=UPI0033376572
MKLPDAAVALFWIFVVIAAWAIAIPVFDIPKYILPSPETIAGRIASRPEYFLSATASTLALIAIGFCSGLLVAIPMAFALAKIKLLERALYPLIVFTQTMPLIAVIPILVIWAGYGLVSTSILVAFSVFFPVLVNGVAGLKSTPARLYFVTRTMGASPFQTLRYVDWFIALPYLLGGLRISLAVATAVAIISEYIASNEGLGFAALIGLRNRDPVQIISVVLIAATLGVVLNTGSLFLEKKMLKRYQD